MSKIEKLSVRGIRSFGSSTQNTIEFHTPLTLIVGHNGAGKTTIIESLRYVTAGDMPPGSAGGAFIHDPKIAHETETKAQVKLKFTSARGLKMVCTRSLVLSQKSGGKATMKTLEGMMTTINPDNGEQVSVTAKCATMETEMPMHLGVSRSVLQNVIFCHQEDSLWPLSEPGAVKKKFDELFDATRYTKAIAQLKDMRKDQVSEIKLSKQEVEFLKSDREKSDKIKQNLESITEQIRRGEERIQILDGEIKGFYALIDSVSKKHQSYLTSFNVIENAKNEIILMRKQEAGILESVDVMDESEEVMQKLLQEQSDILANSDEFFSELERKKTALESRLKEYQNEITQLSASRGKYLSDKDSLNRKVESRNQMIRLISENRNFVNFDSSSLDEDAVSEFTNLLADESAKLQNTFESARYTFQTSEQKLSDDIQTSSSSLKSKEDMKLLKRKTKQDNIIKIGEISKELTSIAQSGASLDDLRFDFGEKTSDLERAKKSVSELNLPAKVSDLESKRAKIESTLAGLKEEMSGLSKDADVRARLSVKQADVSKLENNSKRVAEGALNDLNRIFDVSATAQTFEAELDKVASDRDARRQKLQYAMDKATGHLKTVETKLSLLKAEITSKTDKADKIKADTIGRWGLDPLDCQLAAVEIQITDTTNNLTRYESSSGLYSGFLENSKNDHSCPLCERPFESTALFQQFMGKLREEAESSPSQIKQLQKSLKELQSKRIEMSADMTKWNELSSLTIAIEELKKRQKLLIGEQEEASTNNDDSQGEMALLQMELREIETMNGRKQELDRLRRQIYQLRDEISQITTELAISGSSRTIADVQQDIDDANNEERQIKRQLERLESEMKMRNNDLVNKETRLHELKVELMSLEHRLGDSERLKTQQKETLSENQKIESDLAALDSEIESLKSRVAEKTSQRQEIRQTFESKQKELTAKIQKSQQDTMQLAAVTQEIERYLASGIEEKLGNIDKKVASSEAKADSIKIELETVSRKIADAGLQKSEVENCKRKIKDNLILRRIAREKREKKDFIRSLEAELKTADGSQFKVQLDDLNKKLSIMNGERAGLEGSISQMNLQKKQLKLDLREDYDNIEDRYKKAMIDCATLDMANSDLEKYVKAVDAAIMKYHSIKMDEINRSIRELWMSTYKGHDIDTIEIRADSENSKGNKSYNYRVVMIKGDVSLDMRGRCSAGQKVLASIVIRLALAESFCHHCGILALDEPTTNLDEDNIESLAQSLREIIKHRQKQSNFQLVIITHDEKFVQNLGEYSDYYYRVFKNAEGLSCIVRKSMDEI